MLIVHTHINNGDETTFKGSLFPSVGGFDPFATCTITQPGKQSKVETYYHNVDQIRAHAQALTSLADKMEASNGPTI